MGTEITLTVAGITLDWSKNGMGFDYGFLYQEGDKTWRRPIDFGCEGGTERPGEGLADQWAAFVRPLARILPRLSLLGHTLDAARAEYEEAVDEALRIDETLARSLTDHRVRDTHDSDELDRYMNFEEFCSFVCNFPLHDLDTAYSLRNDEKTKGRFLANAREIARIPRAGAAESWWSELTYFGNMACVLSACSMLQIFGLVKENAGAEVVWEFGPLVEAGWESEDDFRPGARRHQTVLVVTEGASDARILKHALLLFQPDVSDFFRFIDLEEPHPFWGAGNLVKFAQGLIRIDVQNQIIFLLDNDAEGLYAYRRLRELSMPKNMRPLVLPDIKDFQQFAALGPTGVDYCDINGRAAAIECYLDLNLPGHVPAKVLWSNYKKEVDAWQGALECKAAYTSYFLDQTGQSIVDCGYDTFKINEVIAALLAESNALFIDSWAEYR